MSNNIFFYLDLNRTHFSPCHNIIEVILVHEVVSRMPSSHDQGHCGFIILAGTLAEKVAIEGSWGVGYGIPVVVSEKLLGLSLLNSRTILLHWRAIYIYIDLHPSEASQWSLQAAKLGVNNFTSRRLFCPTVHKRFSIILLEHELRR